MIDRLVHRAAILSLKGDSDRLRDRDLGSRPPAPPKSDRQPSRADRSQGRRTALSAPVRTAIRRNRRATVANRVLRPFPIVTREPSEGRSRPRPPPAYGRWRLTRAGPNSTGATGVR